MSLEPLIASRQLRAGRSGSLSVVATIAVAGVVLAVAALVTVMSVTGGFQRLFREKVLGLNAHVLIMRYGLEFEEYREVMRRAGSVDGVVGASPFLFYEMMISAGDALAGVMVKGIEPSTVDQVSDLHQYMLHGVTPAALDRALAHGRDGVILGVELATKLGVGPGDQVLLVSPLDGVDPTNLTSRNLAPRSRQFTVVGLYRSGFFEYDSRLVFVHYRSLQAFFGRGDTVTGVELKVSDIFHSRTIARQVRVKLGDQRYSVTDWVSRLGREYDQVARARERIHWLVFMGLVLLFVLAGGAFLVPAGSRVSRAMAGALLLSGAVVGLVSALATDWGAGLVPAPSTGLTPHVRVLRDDGDFLEYRNAIAEAMVIPEVDRVGPYIHGTAKVLLGGASASQATTVRIRGYDSEARTLPLGRYLIRGTLDHLVPPILPSNRMPPLRVVLGQALAKGLGVTVGSVFRVDPIKGIGDRPLPRVGPYEVEVAGIVSLPDPEADSDTMFMDFVAARRILSMVDAAEGVEVWLHDPMDAPRVAPELASRLGGHSYRTLDWKEINHNIFKSLELQKQSLSLVLFVITVVAALNIVSTLVMLVIDKGHQIAILKTMGATSTSIMRIFVIEGFSIGLLGTLTGLGLGYLVCLLLGSIHFPLEAQVYLIEYLPVDINPADFLIAGVSSLVVSLWATIYPAIRAASLRPVEGMREHGV